MVKVKNYDEALALKTSTKEELSVTRDELKAYRKEKELKKGDVPTDEKVAKKLKKLEEAVEKKETELEEVKAYLAENKPKKEKAARPSKYEYPEGATTSDKKKIRAKARAAEKQKNKPEKVKKEKPAKAEKAAPTEEVKKKSKKEKKAEKKEKAKAATTED